MKSFMNFLMKPSNSLDTIDVSKIKNDGNFTKFNPTETPIKENINYYYVFNDDKIAHRTNYKDRKRKKQRYR